MIQINLFSRFEYLLHNTDGCCAVVLAWLVELAIDREVLGSIPVPVVHLKRAY